MSIFHDEFLEDEFFDGGVVEVPNSVLLSSLDAETIAATYGVSVEDVFFARQDLFFQGAGAPQPPAGQWYAPQPAGQWGAPQPAGQWGAPSRPAGRPRPRPRPNSGRVIVRPGRVVDMRTGGGRSGGRPTPRPPFRSRPQRR